MKGCFTVDCSYLLNEWKKEDSALVEERYDLLEGHRLFALSDLCFPSMVYENVVSLSTCANEHDLWTKF